MAVHVGSTGEQHKPHKAEAAAARDSSARACDGSAAAAGVAGKLLTTPGYGAAPDGTAEVHVNAPAGVKALGAYKFVLNLGEDQPGNNSMQQLQGQEPEQQAQNELAPQVTGKAPVAVLNLADDELSPPSTAFTAAYAAAAVRSKPLAPGKASSGPPSPPIQTVKATALAGLGYQAVVAAGGGPHKGFLPAIHEIERMI
jgi:hypothetical protein